MILNKTFFVLSDLESTLLQSVRFWIKKFTSCQILSVLLLRSGNFSCVYHDRPGFRNVLMYGVSSVSQDILLGWALCTPTVINVIKCIKTANPIRVRSLIYVKKECYLTRFY